MTSIAAKCRDKWRSAPRVISLILIASLSTGMFSLPTGPTNAEASHFSGSASKQTVLDELGSVGSYFTENRGQVTAGVRFYSRGNPSVAFKDDAIVVVLSRQENVDREGANSPRNALLDPAFAEKQSVVRSSAYTIHFRGANSVVPLGRTRLPFSSNFFIGNDSGGWRTDVPNYEEVVYQNLYDGIDLVYHPVPSSVKYEFMVHPDADPEKIEMEYDGAGQLAIDESGIVINTSLGSVRDSKPYAYQQGSVEVECAFSMRSIVSYGFDCGNWDRSETLLIDPLLFSMFIGGTSSDVARDIAIDSSGDVFTVGMTYSTDFPVTAGAFDMVENGGLDVFVSKLNPTGSSLMYSTYIGGSNDDYGYSIEVDSTGNAYIVGTTTSGDFPTTASAYDRTLDGGDAFVAKLDAAGSGLVYSTFLGGSYNDGGASIAIDAVGNAFAVGSTNSSDFPTSPGAFDRSENGFFDAFVTKLNALGTGLLYSTFLGGTESENGQEIDIDVLGNTFVFGHTYSSDFPTSTGAFNRIYEGNLDTFVTELDSTGSGIVYSTYLGGGDWDNPDSLAVDSFGCAYVVGATMSVDFPTTPGAFDRTLAGGQDAFVTKLNATGTGLVYSTFLGGSGTDSARDIALDSAANVYVTGGTGSGNFPITPGAFDSSLNGGFDAYVTKMNATGTGLVYSTFLGGSGDDSGRSIAVDGSADIYVAGSTQSSDFPVTPGVIGSGYGGNSDGFVTKMNSPTTVDLPDLAVAPSDITSVPSGPVLAGSSVITDVVVHNIGNENASQVRVRFYDGPPPSSPRIGADQIIPSIQRFGGTGTASATWIAKPPGTHDICVVADPDNTIAELDETNNIACRQIEVVFSLQLTPGHRFMSFPLTAADDSIGSVLSSIAGCYDYVRWNDPLDAFDHWKSYVLGRSYNDLARLDNTMGFWINITANCSFTPVGTRPVSTTIDLRQGWNMVGFPSFKTAYTVADLRASIGVAGIVVEAFDARASPYYLQRVTDSYVMMAGEGYWVYVPSDAMWTVSG